VVYEVLGAVVFCVMIFPVYWMVSTALKPGNDILRYHPKLVPHPATLANFADAIHRPYFWDDVRNSLIVTSVVVVASVTIAFFAALALAKFRFYGKKAAIVIIIAVQMVPLNALIIPLYVLLSRAHQVDKLSGLIVTYLTFVLPFCVWTLRGFLLGVPKELEEAAMVDGSTRIGAFVRILLPLVAPGLVRRGTSSCSRTSCCAARRTRRSPSGSRRSRRCTAPTGAA
jgi:N,N'-diacetylchitobiose transport system permease protein